MCKQRLLSRRILPIAAIAACGLFGCVGRLTTVDAIDQQASAVEADGGPFGAPVNAPIPAPQPVPIQPLQPPAPPVPEDCSCDGLQDFVALLACIESCPIPLACIDYVPVFDDCEDNGNQTLIWLCYNGFPVWTLDVDWSSGSGHILNLTLVTINEQPSLCLVDWGTVRDCVPWDPSVEPTTANLPPSFIPTIERCYGKTVSRFDVTSDFAPTEIDHCIEESTSTLCQGCCDQEAARINQDGMHELEAGWFRFECYRACRDEVG